MDGEFLAYNVRVSSNPLYPYLWVSKESVYVNDYGVYLINRTTLASPFDAAAFGHLFSPPASGYPWTTYHDVNDADGSAYVLFDGGANGRYLSRLYPDGSSEDHEITHQLPTGFTYLSNWLIYDPDSDQIIIGCGMPSPYHDRILFIDASAYTLNGQTTSGATYGDYEIWADNALTIHGVQNGYLYIVDNGFPPVNRAEDNRKLADADVLENIRRMRPGDIAYGYISACEPFVSTLTAPGRFTVFVYRDPRDMIISHIFYATQMHPEHWMHRYYTETLTTMEERINAAILGVEEKGTELTPIRRRYESYLGWLEQPGVLSLRFEDLVEDRQAALNRLLDYLERGGYRPRVKRPQALAALEDAKVNGKIYTTPVTAGDLILVAPLGTEFYLTALDPNGRQVWTFPPGK